jgi:hypothetical protein
MLSRGIGKCHHKGAGIFANVFQLGLRGIKRRIFGEGRSVWSRSALVMDIKSSISGTLSDVAIEGASGR